MPVSEPEKYPEITIRHASIANKMPVDMSSKAYLFLVKCCLIYELIAFLSQ